MAMHCVSGIKSANMNPLKLPAIYGCYLCRLYFCMLYSRFIQCQWLMGKGKGEEEMREGGRGVLRSWSQAEPHYHTTVRLLIKHLVTMLWPVLPWHASPRHCHGSASPDQQGPLQVWSLRTKGGWAHITRVHIIRREGQLLHWGGPQL